MDWITQVLIDVQNIIPIQISLELIAFFLVLGSIVIAYFFTKLTWPIVKFVFKAIGPPVLFMSILVAALLGWGMLSSEQVRAEMHDLLYGDRWGVLMEEAKQDELRSPMNFLLALLSFIGITYLLYWFLRAILPLSVLLWVLGGAIVLLGDTQELPNLTLNFPPNFPVLLDMSLNECSIYHGVSSHFPVQCNEVFYWLAGATILFFWGLFRLIEFLFPHMKLPFKWWQILLFLFLWPFLLLRLFRGGFSSSSGGSIQSEKKRIPNAALGTLGADAGEHHIKEGYGLPTDEVIATIVGNHIKEGYGLPTDEVIATIVGNHIKEGYGLPTDEVIATIEGNFIKEGYGGLFSKIIGTIK